jgi:predicted Zn-dependent protease
LLDVMESPEELAAVLAHEIAHAEKRHISKRLARQFGLTVLLGAAGGDAVVLREITEQLIASAFDRAQEHEADRAGRDRMARARIDPRVMATAFRHMKQAIEELPRALQVLSTHPDIDDRIRDALAHPIAPGVTFAPLDIDWAAVRKSLPEAAKEAVP